MKFHIQKVMHLQGDAFVLVPRENMKPQDLEKTAEILSSDLFAELVALRDFKAKVQYNLECLK